MRPVIFTPAASAELIKAQDWYARESLALAQRFRGAVDDLTGRMTAMPRQFPIVYKDVRRALLRRLPHALMFVIDPTKP